MPVGFLSPEKILKDIKLKKDMVAADFGCGSGSWVLPLAKILEDGKVFALDALEEPLSALAGKAKSENLSNIEPILSDVEKDIKLEQESCDLVLMTNLLFQIKDRSGVMEKAKAVLKPGGNILIVDWKKDLVVGSSPEKVSAAEVKEIAQNLKLKLEQEFEAGAHHYALVFQKT